jgi:hypothetical protein
MRRLAVLVTTGLMLGGSSIAAPPASAHHDHHKDFSLTGRFTDFDKEDHGQDGPRKGDRYTFGFDLLDDGHDAGNGDGDCVLTEVGDKHDDNHDGRGRDFTARCNVVLKLDDGDLELEGKVTRDDFRDGEVTLPIVDGTDEFDGADGDVTFKPADDHHDRKSHHRGHDDHEFKVDVNLD